MNHTYIYTFYNPQCQFEGLYFTITRSLLNWAIVCQYFIMKIEKFKIYENNFLLKPLNNNPNSMLKLNRRARLIEVDTLVSKSGYHIEEQHMRNVLVRSRLCSVAVAYNVVGSFPETLN